MSEPTPYFRRNFDMHVSDFPTNPPRRPERTIPTLEQIAAQGFLVGSQVPHVLAAVLIVHNRRLEALEQQARPYQEDGELAVNEFREPTTLERTLADVNANLQQRAEAAERELGMANEDVAKVCGERDAARAAVERLTAYVRHAPQCTKSKKDVFGFSDDLFDCTCGLADALKETP